MKEREVYLKELAHAIVGAGQTLQGRPAGWRPREELMLQLESEGVSGGRISSSSGNQASLLRPSTDWMRPTHIMVPNPRYKKSTDLKVITSKKYIQNNI